MRVWAWAVLALGCTAQEDVGAGPTFGGDQAFAEAEGALARGEMPAGGSLTEAGILAAWPVAVADRTCTQGICFTARPVWLPDGDMLVVLGVDAVMTRPPADVAFALDASGSVDGYEDVRAATVEVALDRMTADDTLAVWAFAGSAEELVPAAAVSLAQATEVRTALLALDGLPLLRAYTRAVGCPDTFDDLFLFPVPDALEVAQTVVDTAIASDHGEFGSVEAHPLAGLREVLERSSNDALPDQLLRLACDGGTSLTDAVDAVAATLPDGSSARARRLVLVSDMVGDSPLTAVEDAAERFVGTSVLSITPDSNRSLAASLASAPGAHMLDAEHPAAALAQWEARFDALIAPVAWDLDVQLAEVSDDAWSLERRFGTTDADATGANALFASQGHGAMGVVLSGSDTRQWPHLMVTLRTPEGDLATTVSSRVANRLIVRDWGEGDDEVALDVAWRVAIVEAVQAGDEGKLQGLLRP